MAETRKYIKAQRKDWRSLPRKDDDLRDQRLSMRLTTPELLSIRKLAQAAGMNVPDYMICKTLSLEDRVRPRDEADGK